MKSVIKHLLQVSAALALTFTTAHAQDKPPVVRIATVAYPGTPKPTFTGSAAVVDKEGWLEADLRREGIKLEWVPVGVQSVGATVNEGFANHSIDFAVYGDLPALILNAGGVETRVVVPGGAGMNVYLVVPATSTATSIKDLKGKRIALHRGRPWEISFSRLVAANGLKLSDFKISNLNPPAGAAALAAGNVDAFVTLADAYQLEERKVGKILWSTQSAGEDWKMRMEVWGAKGFIEKYPQVTQIVARAFVKAAHWSSQDKNFEGVVALAKVTGQPESVTRREYKEDALPWRERWSPLYDERLSDHYRYGSAYSKESQLIRQEVDVARLFEPRFVSAVLKELNLDSYWTPRKLVAKAR